MAKFEIFKGKSGSKFEWYWRLIADNGETMCVSEAYTLRWSARRGVRRFKDNVVVANTAEIRD